MDSSFDLSRMGKPTGKAHVRSFDGMLRAEYLALVHNNSRQKRKRLLRRGEGNRTEVILTGLRGSGHQTSSPRTSLLAVVSLRRKPPKTHPKLVQELGAISAEDL